MTVFRAVTLATVLVTLPCAAHAQFGGMPGMPGSPAPGGFSAPSSGPPPACQNLLTLRDQVQKKASAIQRASKRHASPAVACKLFRSFLSTETKMMKAVERDGGQCGVPTSVHTEIKKGHVQAQKIARQVCQAAAQGGQPAAPSLSEAFGSRPVLPSDANKKRGGAFDTLSGSVLTR